MKALNRFIVVDDDPFNNLVCKHIILKFDKDAEITLFTNPEKALQVIEEQYGDKANGSEATVFLDINMPLINGWEFLKKFETFNEKIHDQISIYILSSSLNLNDIEKAKKNPFVKGFHQKPLSLETVHLIKD